LASSAIGGATGQGSGAATALQGDQYNRTLHNRPLEIERLRQLADGDEEKYQRLVTAACAYVHCSAEYPAGSEAHEFFSELERLGHSPDYADEYALLADQTATEPAPRTRMDWELGRDPTRTVDLFTYTGTDRFVDKSKRLDSTYALSTRAGGVLQIGGGLA